MDERQGILKRLRLGQVWLIEMNNQLDGMPNIGIGTSEEKQFTSGIALWDDLEMELRSKHGHVGCVMSDAGFFIAPVSWEKRCDEGAIVTCLGCMDRL